MALVAPGYAPDRTLVEKFGRMSWLLVVVLCALAGVGLAALYSVAGGSWSPWAERHLIRFLTGLALLLAFGLVPLRVWYLWPTRPMSWPSAC